MLKHLVDIMIRALGWGTGILIMSVCFISFIVWEIKHHPKHRLTRAHREKQLKMSCQALHNAPPNRT